MKDPKFYICKHCGNIVEKLHDTGVPIMCCGKPMEEMTPNTVEASAEKHLPEVTVKGDEIHVQVGSVIHPMVEEHHITWIYVQTEDGGFRKDLVPGEVPEATFCLKGHNAVAVYEHCNIHGLWKTVL